MEDRLGNFFFRNRNWLFPLVLILLLLCFRPPAFGGFRGGILLGVGLAFTVAGQSLRIATIGLDYIKRGGKDGRIYADRLVTGGIYRHTRNPMYAGNILITLGFLLVAGNPIALLIGGVFFVSAYWLIMRSEEQYLRREFGEAYTAYCARVPRWLPRSRGLINTLQSYRFDWPAVVVKEYGTIFSTLIIIVGLLAWKDRQSGFLRRDWYWFAAAAAAVCIFYGVARYLKKVIQLKPRGVTLAPNAMDGLRRCIDLIDAAMLDLLNERAQYVSVIFDIKQQTNAPRFDADRSQRIIQRLKGLNRGPLTDAQVETIFGFMLRHWAFEHDRAESEAPAQAPARSRAEAPAGF
jgi:protein-S-isoprenylcysteine O-methyltransferase Ste14/chorismate mutase